MGSQINIQGRSGNRKKTTTTDTCDIVQVTVNLSQNATRSLEKKEIQPSQKSASTMLCSRSSAK